MKSSECFSPNAEIPSCWFVSACGVCSDTSREFSVHTVPFTAIKHHCLRRYIFPDLCCINHCCYPECLFWKATTTKSPFGDVILKNAMEKARAQSHGGSAPSLCSYLPWSHTLDTGLHFQSVISVHWSQKPWVSSNQRGKAVCLLPQTDVWAVSPASNKILRTTVKFTNPLLKQSPWSL